MRQDDRKLGLLGARRPQPAAHFGHRCAVRATARTSRQMSIQGNLLELRELPVQVQGELFPSEFACAAQLPHASHTVSDGVVSRKLDQITLTWSAFRPGY